MNQPSGSHKKLPVLIGYTTPFQSGYPRPKDDGGDYVDELIHVWCPYCRKHHVHGWSKSTPLRAVEHRTAHCHNEGSPFDDGGYYIKREPKRRKTL